MSRHRDTGTHLPRHEAPVLSAILRGEHTAARRSVRWDTRRPIPLGVVELEAQP